MSCFLCLPTCPDCTDTPRCMCNCNPRQPPAPIDWQTRALEAERKLAHALSELLEARSALAVAQAQAQDF